jgi:hypothetical protein
MQLGCSDTVWVCGIPFNFERPDMVHMDGNDGQVDFARGVIQVATHVPKGQVLDVFAHEYIEAANKILALQLDHDTICRLDVVFCNLISEAKKMGLV